MASFIKQSHSYGLLATVSSGAELISCAIDLESSDISMEFSGGQVVRNFANSGFEDKHWTYRNLQKKLKAYVSPLGVIVG